MISPPFDCHRVEAPPPCDLEYNVRPYFLTVCNPDLEDVCFQVRDEYVEEDDDSDYYYPEVHHLKYVVENNTCTGNRDLGKEARLSFVCGHSSTSFYTAIFASFI